MTKFISKIKKAFCISIASWLVVELASTWPSEEAPNFQKANNDWVTDMADILSDRTENELNQMISQLESDNRIEIAVVTVPEIPRTSLAKDKYWEIGKVEKHDGVLFLISARDKPVLKDRFSDNGIASLPQTEILTGYEMTKILPDEKVNKIINTQIIPQFKQKHFDEGTLAGTNELITVIKFREFWGNVLIRRLLGFLLIFPPTLLALLCGKGGGGGGVGFSGSGSVSVSGGGGG
jgi:uncharacterized protein